MRRIATILTTTCLLLAASCNKPSEEQPSGGSEASQSASEASQSGSEASQSASAGEPERERSEPVGEWRQVQADGLNDVQHQQLQAAETARDSLAGQLMARVSEAMGAGGPTEAISVCSTAAPEIAQQVGQQSGLRIGRTSHRLRNPSNIAPEWADDWVQQQIPTPAFFDGPGGELGALFPILTADLCVTCHGRPEQMSPDVRSALADHYPTDQATGFIPGSLRGWFWVEVPPPAE